MNELEWIYVKQDLKLEWAYILLEIKPCGLGSIEFEMWRHFDMKQKSFTLFDCVDCV